MNAETRRIAAKFAFDTPFEVPIPSAPGRGATEKKLEELKNRVVRKALADPKNADREHTVQLAADEAATLAWLTPFPALVFPVLFEERLLVLTWKVKRQTAIYRRSKNLMAHAW